MWTIVIISLLVMLVLAVVFGALLLFAANKLAVKRDSRIDEILSHLAGANCGACGYAGCADFAKSLVEGKAQLSACSATDKENKDAIADLLGFQNTEEETVFVVACSGGNNCLNKYEYQGYGNCLSANLLAGGIKQCPVGCMGLGSCFSACPENAIFYNDGCAEIDSDKCIACGTCFVTCPKKLIKRIPKKAKVYIACSNDCKGKDVRNICKEGCIACGLCAKNCPEGAITMVNNLPRFDYSKCTGCMLCMQKCPSHCIKIHKTE